jgi:predicted aldo/keto reductase-like oxidoreductase
VPIAEILRFERYALDDGSIEMAARLYAGLDRRADACAACGSCLSHCPQALPIPDKLAAVHALFGRP